MLAERHHAYVSASHIRQLPVLPIEGHHPLGVVMMDDHIAELKKAADEQALALKEMVAVILTAAPALGGWSEREGLLPQDVSIDARVADMVIFAKCANAPAEDQSALIEEAIFQSGGPILVVPENAFDAPPQRIMIAWNGSREAARALSAALPLLKDASAVAIISFGASLSGAPDASAAAAFLKLHGVAAETRTKPRSERDGEHFLAEAAAWGADLAVMGAYSHPRWRQIVLGGFTRDMLKQSALPVMMAH
ncbi:MAG: universal stress protein [Parvularculaceae bacterium]|nr:universal stress protein [Parvularculaceae bacterium]